MGPKSKKQLLESLEERQIKAVEASLDKNMVGLGAGCWCTQRCVHYARRFWRLNDPNYAGLRESRPREAKT
jgi:hypothetical protein